MDIYESLEKIKSADIKDEFEKFSGYAKILAANGMDKKYILELLFLKGCSNDVAEKIAKNQTDSLPENFNTETPPVSFTDVESKVRETIQSASIKDIETYFEKYAGKEFEGIKNRILIARDNSSESLVSEIVREIEPFVDGLIVENTALSNEEKQADQVDDKEILEQNLFGIWPVSMITKKRSIDNADKKLIARCIKMNPDSHISFV